MTEGGGNETFLTLHLRDGKCPANTAHLLPFDVPSAIDRQGRPLRGRNSRPGMGRMRIHTQDFENIPATTRFGLYLIQAKRDPTYYRLGCSGTSSQNKGEAGLKARLAQHDRPYGNPKNLTERLAHWTPCWACELPAAFTKRLTLFAELAMFGHFTGIYTFDFSEKDESIFHTSEDFAAVLSYTKLFEVRLRSLLHLQGCPTA